MQSWSTTPFLVLDTETTGTDPQEARIVELGAAHFHQGRVRGHRQLVNPGLAIPAEASAVHGIYDRHVQGKPCFADVAPALLAHVDPPTYGRTPQERDRPRPLLVGYNAVAYDGPLLNAELHRAGHPARIDLAQVLDVIAFVRWHLRHLRVRRLVEVCGLYEIALDQAHSAAADAQATGLLLLRLVREGLIPQDPDAALARQAEILPRLLEEWGRWAYWLYRDRHDERLIIGCGKAIGVPLEHADPAWCRYVVDKVQDLPEEVRQLFTARATAPGHSFTHLLITGGAAADG